jgi:hypothetical protein
MVVRTMKGRDGASVNLWLSGTTYDDWTLERISHHHIIANNPKYPINSVVLDLENPVAVEEMP